MVYIFEISDKSGRSIRLTEERWKHIAKEHPNIVDIEEIKNTLTNPTKTKHSKYDTKVVWHYRFIKSKKKYLFVAVKYLNGDGFVITSYYVKKIK